MKFLNLVCSLTIYLCSQSISFCQTKSLGNLIVVIDPGHGGIDSGAIGINGVNEKDVVLSIARKIDSLNSAFLNAQFDVYLTRYKDTLLSLSDRTKLSKSLSVDVFISLHCNQATNSNAAGTEVYLFPKSNVEPERSFLLGSLIQQKLLNILGIKNRGAKYGDFQVLRDNADGSATLLLELGYLSQKDEAMYFLSEESQIAIAMVILESISKFLKL